MYFIFTDLDKLCILVDTMAKQSIGHTSFPISTQTLNLIHAFTVQDNITF